MGEFALMGKLCTRIVEGHYSFIIEKPPLDVLDEAIRQIGYNLKGAIECSKLTLGKTSMVPIMINPAQGVCMFPIISPYKHNCVWFNPMHIIDTESNGSQTIVHLSNSSVIPVEMRLPTFNAKWHNAKKYCEKTFQRALGEITSFRQSPIEKREIIIEKTGKYNFDMFKTNKEGL